MAQENDGLVEVGTETVEGVVVTEGGEPTALVIDLPEGETEGEIVADESDAVTLARIEADKEITIAAIHADANTAIAETDAEVRTAVIEAEIEREQQPWEIALTELRNEIAELNSRLLDLSTGLPNPSELTPTPPLELAAEIAEEVAENNLTPQSMLDPTSETQTEVTLESGDGKPEAEATVVVRRKRRLI